ncbi:DUF262 domain-containing protein [Vibrio sp. SCSIO 43140]|uniref:DUF262 domain-containing protein n=1 Tax=Vibrio sp. SCSIO 43140 TaxID=2819100 RepID=UPI002075AC49|nr:DUF262 domain-containing protein [Vibrio sp. SCSIO 43140]USD59495.1 DUF262 domain-containing protein [Vibrio sp. SCSIO 43140]
MQKSLDIFKAEPQSVFDVICDRKTTGFYMPAYQRPYSWEETHIRDLFSDCENVFRNLLESSDAIIFLGSVLSVDDSEGNTVYPIAKRHTPTTIKLIIDGQQRLSTLMLIILCLNERLRILLPQLKKAIKKEENEESLDALEQLREVVSELIRDTSNYSVETTADHELYKFLPKIIRSQVDRWGKDERKAIYESPISQLLSSYQRHTLEQESSSIFKPLELSSFDEGSKRVVSNIKEIRKQLDCVEKGFKFKLPGGDVEEPLSVEDFVGVETLDKCLDFPVDEHLLNASRANDKIDQIVYLVAFSKFLLHRVCLTFVQVDNESYAFDMFEALNTTGEPLTAIETFVPKVIEHIGRKRKDGAAEEDLEGLMSLLNGVTERFENIIKNKEKNDKTKALILAFVRAYVGKVKVTTLRDQRDAMLKSYEDCSFHRKDEYLEYLATSADFLFEHWQLPASDVKELVPTESKEVSNVCLRYLADIKHDIAQSLLIQFILQDKKCGDTGTQFSSFEPALKAVTAFSVLWRAMSGGADGIDAVYRKLHEKGIDGIPYQLRSSDLTSEHPNVDKVKAFFREELKDKIRSKGSPQNLEFEQWLDICSKQQLLDKPKNTKFLLLAGFHNLELVDGGFNRVSSNGTDYFTTMMWELLSSKDRIKKVYEGSSQSAFKKWGDSDISSPDVYNKLGNVLVDARNSISSKTQESWYDLKQHMLEALSNDSIDEIETILNSESELSAEAVKNASLLMLEKKFLEITWAESWNKTAIEERTEILLKNAWLNLTEWLDWEA